jgi:hypothetical protein
VQYRVPPAASIPSIRFTGFTVTGDVQLFKSMSSPAPKSPEQSEKSKKYDRQLRFVILLFVNVSVIAQV